MPELSYPHYRLQADGPSETGCFITLTIQDGVGGPLPGMTSAQILDHLKTHLAGTNGDVHVTLTGLEIATTNL